MLTGVALSGGALAGAAPGEDRLQTGRDFTTETPGGGMTRGPTDVLQPVPI